MIVIWTVLPEMTDIQTAIESLIDLFETELDITDNSPDVEVENAQHATAVANVVREFDEALAEAGRQPVRTLACAAIALTGRISVHEPGLMWAAQAFVDAARALEPQLDTEPASECEAVVWLLAATAANIRRGIYPGDWDAAAEPAAAVDRIEALLAGRAPPALTAAVESVIAADADVDCDVAVAIDAVENPVCRWAAGAVVAVDGELADDCIGELYAVIDNMSDMVSEDAAVGVRLAALLIVMARRAYADIDDRAECAAIADALERRRLPMRIELPSLIL